jgi:hypothetical protein
MNSGMNRIRWWQLNLLLLLTLGLSACRTPPPASQYDPAKPPEPYMRVTRATNGAASLDIVVREFQSADKHQPKIYLVAVSHLGDEAYYSQLQSLLESTDRVLFEGVRASEERAKPKPRDSSAPPRPKMPKPEAGQYSLQADMAKSLGLKFQLEAIDYERPHFLNSDMTILQISEVLNPSQHQGPPPGTAAKSGRPARPTDEDTGSAQFENLLSAMDGSGFLGKVLQIGLRFIGSSEKMQALVKLTFIEVLGGLDGDLSNLEIPSPGLKELLSVLIQKRNAVVIEDVRAAMHEANPPKSIAIFYGAAHMPDMEMRLRKELNYRPAHDQWFPAFGVDPVKSGLSQADIQMIKGMVDIQMKMLKPQPK